MALGEYPGGLQIEVTLGLAFISAFVTCPASLYIGY